MSVQDVRQRSITKSAILSGFQMARVIAPGEVIRVLNGAKIRFVLVGAYGLAGWSKEARATEDVDVLVAAQQVKKAVRVLLEAFPLLDEVDLPVVTRLQDRETGKVAIDVMKPLQQPHRAVFKHTRKETAWGQTFRVPTLEMALVMKSADMISLYRADEDKYQDAHDFILMAKRNPDADEGKLAEIGSLLYPEGGKDLVEMARKARAGEKLNL